jgi:hypothetical protein
MVRDSSVLTSCSAFPEAGGVRWPREVELLVRASTGVAATLRLCSAWRGGSRPSDRGDLMTM